MQVQMQMRMNQMQMQVKIHPSHASASANDAFAFANTNAFEHKPVLGSPIHNASSFLVRRAKACTFVGTFQHMMQHHETNLWARVM